MAPIFYSKRASLWGVLGGVVLASIFLVYEIFSIPDLASLRPVPGTVSLVVKAGTTRLTFRGRDGVVYVVGIPKLIGRLQSAWDGKAANALVAENGWIVGLTIDGSVVLKPEAFAHMKSAYLWTLLAFVAIAVVVVYLLNRDWENGNQRGH